MVINAGRRQGFGDWAPPDIIGGIEQPVSGGFNWDTFGDILDRGLTFTTRVLTLRPPPGTTIQTGQQGTIVQRTSTGLAPGIIGFPGGIGGIGMGGILLLGGGALLLYAAMKGRRS